MTDGSTTFNPANIDVSGDITLVLAQRTSTVKGHRLAMHTDVGDELQNTCYATLDRLAALTPLAYADSLDFDPGTHYLVVPLPELVAHRPAPRRGRRRAGEDAVPIIEVDAASLNVLRDASSLHQLRANELKRRSFLFHAAVVGNDPSRRVAFVSKVNPYKAALSGRLLTWFGDRLRKVDGPLLAFAPTFDLIVTEDAVVVLDAAAFEKVFRDIDAMRERIPIWSRAVAELLPLDDASATKLGEACQRSARIARQARAIYERGGLTRFTAAQLRDEMTRQGLDASRLVRNGKLVLDDDDIAPVLKLVDEKLYLGWHSDTAWDVGTRSARS